jgi:outer membrane protein TolC
LSWRLCLAGAPLAGLACSAASSYPDDYPPMPPLRAPVEEPPQPATAAVVPAAHAEPAAPQEPHQVPISLDAVLRLAEGGNARIGLARERLHETEIASEAALTWLPNVYAGMAYYRHEGGIQNENGTLTHSSTGALVPGFQVQGELDLRESTFQSLSNERKVWQNKAELSQVNFEVLQEAAQTYVDLLTAQRGAALTEELDRLERKTLEKAEKLAKDDSGAEALAQSLRASLQNRAATRARLRQQAGAASAKLVYLLGLAPEACLVPVDHGLVPVELIDSTPPACELVEQALAYGPGVRELEAIAGVIQLGIDKSYGLHNLLPTFQVCVFEGAFGAGPGASLAWDNRLDVGLQARWNLTQLFRTPELRLQAQSRLAQAHYTLADVRGKLAAGVKEARDAILAGREQIGLATAQIKNASDSYELSQKRQEQGARGATLSDVALALRGLEQAHFNHVAAISGHNKAQVRLLLLLGNGPAPAKREPGAAPGCPGPVAPAPAPSLLPPPNPAPGGKG